MNTKNYQGMTNEQLAKEARANRQWAEDARVEWVEADRTKRSITDDDAARTRFNEMMQYRKDHDAVVQVLVDRANATAPPQDES